MRRAIFIFFIVGLFSCQEEVTTPPSKITFVPPTIYYSEFEGVFFVPLELDKPQFSYASIDFETKYVSSSTTAGDFVYINRFLPLTFYGGMKVGKISGSIFDDRIADGNDTVEFTLESATSNVVLPVNPKDRIGRLIVVDDDNIPANEMLIQLKWSATGARNDREDMNFDLQLLTDVVIDNGIKSSTMVAESHNLDKFESIRVNESIPDGEYYIRIDYRSHNANITAKANPILKFSGFGHNDSNDNRWQFEFLANQVNYYAWLGPFKKQGRTFVLKED